GEGVVGLSRAFFFAGARAVMASLWNINDESTAAFMARFYGSLRTGQSIDAAARAAKLAFIGAGGALRHPYYWSAFVVSGDGSAGVAVARGWRAFTMPAAILASIIVLAGVA